MEEAKALVLIVQMCLGYFCEFEMTNPPCEMMVQRYNEIAVPVQRSPTKRVLLPMGKEFINLCAIDTEGNTNGPNNFDLTD